MSLNWWMLYFAIAFEVFGTSCLKLSEGLTRWGFFGFALALYAISFVFLAAALRHIPVSVAYAIWSGLGTVLVVLLGWLWFGEPMSALRGLFIAMIVVGAIGLNLVAADS